MGMNGFLIFLFEMPLIKWLENTGYSKVGLILFGAIGYQADSSGTATVEGSDSTWTNSAGLIVGEYGAGALNIINGGTVSNANGFVGRYSGSSGTVNVGGTGVDATWSTSGSLYVGGNQTAAGGTGTVTVSNDGQIDVGGTLKTWNTGTLNLNGGNITTDSFDAAAGTFNFTDGALTIDGGTYSDGNTSLVINSIGISDNPTLVLTNGASTTTAENTIIGTSGAGTLDILNSSNVANNFGIIGNYSGSSGTVMVDGAGSTWTNAAWLTIGYTGTGTLNILNGGSVSNTYADIGFDVGSTGTVTVDGTDSTWTNSQWLAVGQYGNGTLNIQNGGTVSNIVTHIGSSTGSTGLVTVDGMGSNWTNLSWFYIGLSGDGTLNVRNGGTVANYQAFIGHDAGGIGTATVDGPGSVWTTTGALYVGGNETAAGGTGTVNVSNGGQVDVSGNLKIWNTGTFNLNGGTVDTGDLTVDGAFNFNAGTLSVANNLLLDASAPLATNLSLTGFKTVNVGGTTTLAGYNTLSIDGGTFATGSLVNNGGFAFNSGTFNLTSDDLTVGNGGLFGPLLLMDYNKNLNVSNNTTVDAGATLYMNGGHFSSGTTTNNGTVELDGPVATIGGGTFTNNGLLTGNGTVNAVLHNASGGDIRSTLGDTLTFSGTGNTNDGSLSLLGGTVAFTQDLTNNPAGQIAGHGALITGTGLTNHGTLAFTDTTDIQGDVNNDTGGTIIISGRTTTFYDDVVHNGTEIRVSSGSSAVFFGAVSGSGPYTGTGSLFFEGDLNPGNSPGLVSVEGDLPLGVNSHTIMEIAGLDRGSQYDAFDIGGMLQLGGELDVTRYNLGGGLFDPQLGESFDLFAADTITGSFDLVTLAALGDGLGWQLEILPDAIGTTDVVRLNVVPSQVPVPPSVWLFGSGLLGLIGIARRRRAA